MKIQKNKKRKGFTLIEMMIVMAIIGLLMAMLVPNVIGYRRSAIATSERALQANIATAISAAEIQQGSDLNSELTGTDPENNAALATLVNDYVDGQGTSSLTFIWNSGTTAPAASANADTWTIFYNTSTSMYTVIPPTTSEISDDAAYNIRSMY